MWAIEYKYKNNYVLHMFKLGQRITHTQIYDMFNMIDVACNHDDMTPIAFCSLYICWGNVECATVSILLVARPVNDVDHIFASIFIYIRPTQTI